MWVLTTYSSGFSTFCHVVLLPLTLSLLLFYERVVCTMLSLALTAPSVDLYTYTVCWLYHDYFFLLSSYKNLKMLLLVSLVKFASDTLSTQIPPHLKCVAILPCEIHMFKICTECSHRSGRSADHVCMHWRECGYGRWAGTKPWRPAVNSRPIA